jgi:hypothetical protein
MIVSFGTIVAGSGLVTLEKSPPFWEPGWIGALGDGGTPWTGALGAGAPWMMLWPQAGNAADRQRVIRKPIHLDFILLPP